MKMSAGPPTKKAFGEKKKERKRLEKLEIALRSFQACQLHKSAIL